MPEPRHDFTGASTGAATRAAAKLESSGDVLAALARRTTLGPPAIDVAASPSFRPDNLRPRPEREDPAPRLARRPTCPTAFAGPAAPQDLRRRGAGPWGPEGVSSAHRRHALFESPRHGHRLTARACLRKGPCGRLSAGCGRAPLARVAFPAASKTPALKFLLRSTTRRPSSRSPSRSFVLSPRISLAANFDDVPARRLPARR